MNEYLAVLAGTGLTFGSTVLGAGVVFFFSKEPSERLSQLLLGFASGIMLAASVWSLLIPSMEMAETAGTPGWLPGAGGFALGGLFLWGLDRILPHAHSRKDGCEGLPSKLGHSAMLFFAVTLHNIPEGMAVGLAFAVAAETGEISFAAAFALAIGVALQNFPEGAAISLPLRQDGMSRSAAFGYGAVSGLVEPVGAVLTVLLMEMVRPVLPWFLSFAAGAMVFVVAEELIPQAHIGREGNQNPGRQSTTHLPTLGVMLGFLLMMVLDVVLGA